jgi:hypothetical protein
MNTPKSLLRIVTILLALAVTLSACFTGTPRIYDPGDENAIYTAAAQTVVAQATLSAGQTAVAQLTQMAQGGVPSATPVGAATGLPPTATLPSQPIATLFVPTATQIFIPPTRTLPPPPPPVWTPVPQACDWAQFAGDVTYPDGSSVPAGAAFTKVWLLRNIGACTWTTAYGLVFVDGERMQARKYIPLYRNVRPGETIEVSVDFIAPASSGRYRSYWMVSNQNGLEFGIGQSARTAFWADIRVEGVVNTDGYDFAANVCNAVWRSNSGVLPCPGNPESPAGAVVWINNPVVETGKQENEPALLTRPDSSRDGVITGTFPAYMVRSGDRFMADIGCIYRSRRCDVTFSLDYQVGNQTVRNLGSWHEVYEEQMMRANIDLSALAGQAVTFILRVENNGNWSEANALWFVPTISRNSPPPPPPTQSSEPAAIAAARIKLADDLDVNPNQLQLIDYEAAYWPDSCLGLPMPGQVCTPVVIFGYRIIWQLNGNVYEAHTDENGTVVNWVAISS